MTNDIPVFGWVPAPCDALNAKDAAMNQLGIANNMPELKKVENMFERVHWSLGCTSVCGAQTNGC